MKKNRVRRPKPVSYTLIPPQSDIGFPMYALLHEIIDESHEELSRTNVRVALAWATSWKPDVDGRLVLGKCKKASDLDRELAPYDFVILLNRDYERLPIDQVVPSKTNPRTHFDGGLHRRARRQHRRQGRRAADSRAPGRRRQPQADEVRDHRRRMPVRASKVAGQTHIPALIRSTPTSRCSRCS
jgi:hypothetical protein